MAKFSSTPVYEFLYKIEWLNLAQAAEPLCLFEKKKGRLWEAALIRGDSDAG